MSQNERFKTRLLFIGVIIYFASGYLGTNFLSTLHTHFFYPELAFEKDIPFIPEFVLAYMLIYLNVIFFYALVNDYTLFKKAAILFTILSTFHFMIFLIFPVEMIRPTLTPPLSWSEYLVQLNYMADRPFNCFPSLHVSLPFLATLLLWNYKRRWGIIFLAGTLLIALSTLFIKQHYLVDIIGAFGVTTIIFYLHARITHSSFVPTGS